MGNPVVHWELMSKDPAKISTFYEQIFGWRVQHRPELNYYIVETGGGQAETARAPVDGVAGDLNQTAPFERLQIGGQSRTIHRQQPRDIRHAGRLRPIQ